MLAEILEERVVSSRGRQIPRGVKRKMSNFPLRPRNASATGPVSGGDIKQNQRRQWHSGIRRSLKRPIKGRGV